MAQVILVDVVRVNPWQFDEIDFLRQNRRRPENYSCTVDGTPSADQVVFQQVHNSVHSFVCFVRQTALSIQEEPGRILIFLELIY